jgi:serine/threonine protein kinase
MDPAKVPVSAQAGVVFTDGLGERRCTSDPTGTGTLEVLCLKDELTAVPSFEFALRERVSRLANFRHNSYARVRSVDRLNDPNSTLAIVSDHVTGVRLSDMLAAIERKGLVLELGASLCLMRHLVPGLAALHDHARDIAHGALSPERIIVTPKGRMVIVEHVMGAALEQLRFSHEKYWKDIHVALPRSAGQPRFDHRADVLQLGLVSLALVLGRPLQDDEYPMKIGEVVAAAWGISPGGSFEALPAGLRAWLTRLLQLDVRASFTSASDARAEFEKLISEGEIVPAPDALEAFLEQYQTAVGLPSAPAAAAAPPVRPMSAPTPPPMKKPEPSKPSQPVNPAPPRRPPAAASGEPFPLPSTTLKPPAAAKPSPPIFEPPAASEPARSAYDTTRKEKVYDAPRKDDQFEILSIASAPTPARPQKFDQKFDQSRQPPPNTHKEPPPDIGTLASMWTAGPAESPTHATGRHKRKTHIPRPFLIAAVATAVLAIAALMMARWYFAPPAAPSGTGTVSIITNPAGAQVIVDGESRGVTPVTLTLKAGVHVMQLRGAGQMRSMPVAVAANTTVSQYIELPKNASGSGQLQVKTEPPGAQISVDGMPRGPSPVTVAGLAPGEHVVTIANEAGSVKHPVTILADATASLVVPLGAPEGAPVSGWIAVSAPVEVEIYENNRLIGSSQSERLMVAAGRHEIEIKNEPLGYRVARTVQVPAGKVAAVKIDFPNGTIAINAIPWAEIWIDGEKIGETPIGNLPIRIGPHEVVFRNPELGEQRHAVTVTMTSPARLSVDMRQK